ncbi:LPS export ABC transporter periplasmic protein LptC [Marinobacter fuscus]|uniref:Lipopolysaccharide export system protein LptC n=1 Tax=Marinobacter fuscus TaxID=2109942 RepID=A0A2T1K878_9GAMM|nr:LPS export ABC transporter periplasmic protein LptC [Marinobacter fuscus]PSF05963.1 LPS export ABC transporter periplasmic protein LptC [Marinobacter fuscus]
MIRDLLTGHNGKPRLRMLALAGTLAATVFLMWQSDAPVSLRDDGSDLRGSAEPDGFVINGQYRSWNEQGKLAIQLNSPRIEQFDHSGVARIVQPRARLSGQKNADPWLIEADEGSLQQATERLELTGNVQLIHQLGDQQARLETEALTLDNQAGTIATDQPVVITEPHGVTRSTGMKAWIDERILELHSRVEGHYETAR